MVNRTRSDIDNAHAYQRAQTHGQSCIAPVSSVYEHQHGDLTVLRCKSTAKQSMVAFVWHGPVPQQVTEAQRHWDTATTTHLGRLTTTGCGQTAVCRHHSTPVVIAKLLTIDKSAHRQGRRGVAGHVHSTEQRFTTASRKCRQVPVRKATTRS